jgi:lipopolysaccharide transport system ATP-binding protein
MGQIQVTDLGKAYRQYASHWSRLAEWLDPRNIAHHRDKWILKNIHFHVHSGEAVAIVGVNGAGKSTLLKLITGTLNPTVGSVQLKGHVAALLELGMGFHPDFTGRQNVMMAGQLLGMQPAKILELMPEIEAFAEIGSYIDEPVRIYSSGMQVRLAFSVATAVRPDILIVDEALSVGDAYFQHKSFARIRQFREQGTTLLLVTHDGHAIQSICDRAILLDQGGIIQDGPPNIVMDFYNALIAEREESTVKQVLNAQGQVQTQSGTGEATVTSIALEDEKGNALEAIELGKKVCLRVGVAVRKPIERLVLGYMIKNRLGQPMYGTNTHFLEAPLIDLGEGQSIEYRFEFPMNLGMGSYSIATSLSSTQDHLTNNYEWRDLALIFNVYNVNEPNFVGCNWMPPKLKLEVFPADAD